MNKKGRFSAVSGPFSPPFSSIHLPEPFFLHGNLTEHFVSGSPTIAKMPGTSRMPISLRESLNNVKKARPTNSLSLLSLDLYVFPCSLVTNPTSVS